MEKYKFIIFISISFTGKFKILDIGINRIFKVCIYNLFYEYVIKYTNDNRVIAYQYNITDQISDLQNQVSKDAIINVQR